MELDVVVETCTVGAFSSKLGELALVLKGFSTRMIPAKATIPTSKMRERRVGSLFFKRGFAPDIRDDATDYIMTFPKRLPNL